MQCFVSSCFTACSTGVSQPFTCSAPVLCRGHSVINTLILQMETRIGKCPAPTDSCHAMPVHSAGAQLLRGADMAVNSASQPLSPWCLQSAIHGTREGTCGHALPRPCGFLAVGHAKHSSGCTGDVLTAPPLPCAHGRGVCEPHRWAMGWCSLGKRLPWKCFYITCPNFSSVPAQVPFLILTQWLR